MGSTHETVYDALVKKKNVERALQSERYVLLYPQRPCCAILYAPGGRYNSAPLALNEARDSFRNDVFRRISSAIEFVRRDKKGPGKEAQNWNHYRVADWRRFAEGLESVERDEPGALNGSRNRRNASLAPRHPR